MHIYSLQVTQWVFNEDDYFGYKNMRLKQGIEIMLKTIKGRPRCLQIAHFTFLL